MTKKYTYDIEVFPNLFCVTFYNIDTKESFLFSIYDGRNDLKELEKFLDRDIVIIGYNNIMYDATVMQFLIQNKTNKNLLQSVFEFSGELIGSDRGFTNYGFRKYQYPENVKYSQIDLMKIIEISGVAPSLKQVAISLKWHRIQDLPLDYDHVISSKEEEYLVYDYNLNDTLITNKLYENLLPKIELRYSLSEMYGVNLLSSSNSKMADRILEKYYSDVLHADMKKIKTLRTEREQFFLRDCIASNIVFETKLLRRVKTEIENTLVRKVTKFKYSKTITFGDNKYEMGVGGLHSVDSPSLFVKTDDYSIYDQDVASYYPNMMINNKIMPEHLGGDFINILTKLTGERLSAKKTNKVKAEGLKITINSIFGKLGSDTFWLYDPKAMCSVTVSGQLYLMMLIEKLVLNGIHVISANTDGVTSRVHVSQEKLFKEIGEWWEHQTSLTLEKTEYEKYFRQDVNNYITRKTDGDVKVKGRYVKETGVEKGYKYPIVSLAMCEYALNGIEVEKTIRNHKNIIDFCISQKVGKDFQTEYHLTNSEVENLQKNNRFFISVKGGRLNKHGKIKGNNIGLYVGNNVTILNDYDEKISIEEYDIDYAFYIEEAGKYTNNVERYIGQPAPFVDESEDYVPPSDLKEKEKFFFDYYMLKNISENFVESLLWLKSNFKGEDFCDFLIFAVDNKKLSAKIQTMIKLNYFSTFGNQKELLSFYEEFTKGENKYTFSLSEKSKLKRIPLLKKSLVWGRGEVFTMYEQIMNESSVIGFPYSKYEVDKYYVYVKELNTRKSYHPTMKVQILLTGETKELKINKNTHEEHPVVEGDILFCKSFSKRNRKTKNELGSWIETDVVDLYLETYYKMKPEDEFEKG